MNEIMIVLHCFYKFNYLVKNAMYICKQLSKVMIYFKTYM